MKCSTDLVIDERFDSLTLTNLVCQISNVALSLPSGVKGLLQRFSISLL